MTKTFRCFQAETFAEVNPTALAGQHRGFFLAAHVPTLLVQLDAQYKHLSEESHRVGEDHLLAALREPQADKVMFSILRGSTGSGKSHLIRWLYFKLEAEKLPDMRLLLIRRDETNLREIIRKIVEIAADDPGELLTEIREKLQVRQELNDTGKRNLLLDELAREVDPNNFDSMAVDPYSGLTDRREIEARKTAVKHLPAFFRDEVYRAHLSATGGVVDELVRLTVGERTGNQLRDRPREFVPEDFDLPDELVYGSGSADPRAQGVPPAVRFAQYLKTNLGLRVQAATYVNTRLKQCTDRLLNLEGVSLLEVFTEIRKRLQNGPRPLRLVLLIEDLADVEYMHRQVLEALIADPNPELCPLASVVGVSDGFSSTIPVNIRDRAGQNIYSLDVQHGHDGYLFEFTVRYLNALRTPLAVLEDRAGLPAPSACNGCEHNTNGQCHHAFGVVGKGDAAVGLFPFNKHALDTMYRKAHTRDREKSDFNPRQFLGGLLVPALIKEAESFAAGLYPPKGLRGLFVEGSAQTGVLQTKNREFGTGRGEQAETLQAIWGHKLSAEVYKVFGLRAAEELAPQPPNVSPQAVVGPISDVSPVPPVVSDIQTEPNISITQSGDTPISGPGADLLLTAIADLDRFHSGDRVGQSTLKLLRAVVRSAVVSRIDWNRLFMEQRDWDQPGNLSDDYINLEQAGMPGQLGGPEGRRLVVPRNYPDRPDLYPAVGLQGLLLAYHFRGWNFTHATQPGQYYLRHSLPIVDRLAGEAETRFQRSFAPPNFDMTAAGLELLAIAARLQGDLPPNADDPTLVNALVAERTDWNSDPNDPNRSWDALMGALGQNFEQVRKRVISSLNCTKGAGQSVVLDADRLLAAVTSWSGRCGKPKEPLPVSGQIHQHWSPLNNLRKVIDQHLTPAVIFEAKAWGEWVQDVDKQLEGEKPSKLLEEGRLFHTESAAVYRCSFTNEDLERLKNRSRFLSVQRSHDNADRTIDRTHLANLGRMFEGVLEAQSGPDEPARPSAFEEALAAAREVAGAFKDSPDALDQLLPLLGRCRSNAKWVEARSAWWNYTLVLATAVKQTTAILNTTDAANVKAAQDKVGKLLKKITEDATAIEGVLK